MTLETGEATQSSKITNQFVVSYFFCSSPFRYLEPPMFILYVYVCARTPSLYPTSPLLFIAHDIHTRCRHFLNRKFALLLGICVAFLLVEVCMLILFFSSVDCECAEMCTYSTDPSCPYYPYYDSPTALVRHCSRPKRQMVRPS